MNIREPWRSVLVAILTALLTILGGQTVGWFGCSGPQPPLPKPEPKPEPERTPPPAADPTQAIVKTIMQGGYCSGTIVGPKRKDGRYFVVSAAHCYRRVGESVIVSLRDGRSYRSNVIAINRKADCAILLLENPVPELPYLPVAERTPPVGTKVFHAGFGVHIPGNREDGVLVAGPNSDEQVRYRLSVSHGDSGGGIIASETKELLSPVCCTTRIAGIGDVWGAAPEVIQRMLADPTSFSDVPPIQMPLRDELPSDGGK